MLEQGSLKSGSISVKITDSLGNVIGPAQEDGNLASVAGFQIPAYDSIYATYPTTSQEVYTYKKNGATVGTITVNYSDAVTKLIVSSVIKS